MKIALVADSLVRGGMERRLLELIKGLASYPDITLQLVIFSERIDYPEVYDLGIPITLIKRVPKKNPLVFYKFYKFCKSWRPDLLHTWGTMSAIWAIPTSGLLKIKLINGNIVDAPKSMSVLDKRLFRARLTFPFSSVIVSNSIAGLTAYKVPRHKGICIYNGFDNKRIDNIKDKTAVRKELGLRTPKVVGMLGSFADRKDYKTFILAAIDILKQREDITFVAVGDGPSLQECKQLVPSVYGHLILFPGERHDAESIINTFDIGVLSTNAHMHGEGVSNVILEYMALGKPVVASRGGGTPEIVHDQSTGILVEPNSPAALYDALMHLLNEEEIRVKMGNKGKQRVKSDFSLSKMTRAYYELYRRLGENM